MFKQTISLILLLVTSVISSDSTNVLTLRANSEKGELESQYKLAMLLLKQFHPSRGSYEEISQSNFEAEKWLHRAAGKGHLLSQYQLGIIYFPDYADGYGFSDEVWRARRELRKVVNPDSLESVVSNYGIPYEISSEGWLLKAANSGLPEAQYALAQLYMTGYGNQGNFEVGIAWLEKAAQQGHIYSQNELGLLYSTPGPIMNFPRAYFWSCVARESNYEPAFELLRNIENRIPNKDLIEAQKLLDEWHNQKK